MEYKLSMLQKLRGMKDPEPYAKVTYIHRDDEQVVEFPKSWVDCRTPWFFLGVLGAIVFFLVVMWLRS